MDNSLPSVQREERRKNVAGSNKATLRHKQIISVFFTTDIEFSLFVQFSVYLLVLSVKYYVTEKLIFNSVLVLKGSCKFVFSKIGTSCGLLLIFSHCLGACIHVPR